MFCRKLISLLTVHVNQSLNFPLEVVLALGGIEHEKHHFNFLALLQLFENIVEMDALSKAVALGYSKNGPFESDLVIGVNNTSPECNFC